MEGKSIDKIHGDILSGLNTLQFNEFEGLNLSKTLYNESYYSLTRPKCEIIKQLLGSILFNGPKLLFSIKGNELLMITYDYQRNDHRSYWEAILALFPNYDEIFITDNLSLREKVHLRGLLSRSKRLIKYFSKLVFINNMTARIYLASRLTIQYLVLKKVKRVLPNYKTAICFYDGGFCESVIMSYLKTKGCLTVTNQHGQPLFRDKQSDRMNQSQILNVISDCFFAKGRFTQIQLAKAGYQTDRVKIVGDIISEAMSQAPSRVDKSVFGVLLDCPTYNFASMSNRRMIEFAKQISKDLNNKYIIRSHPQETPERYKNLIDGNCVGMYGKEMRLNEIFELIDFSLFHASAVYLDLLKANIRGYQVDCGIEFPIVMDNSDVVHDKAELIEQVKTWKELLPEERENSIKNRLKDYIECTGEEAKEIYSKTIYRFLNDPNQHVEVQ